MAEELSKTLKRQIQKFLAGKTEDPGIQEFLQAVNETYRFSERDRELLERSLELTSGELTALNEKIRLEKVQALERLSESEQILKSINENLSEGVFRLESNGRILFANRAFVGLVSSDQWQDLTGQTIEGFFADPETWFTLKSILEINGVLKNEETQMKGGPQGRIWVLISMVKLARNGHVDIYDGSVVNITQQKETERNLRRANDILANTINIRKKAEEDLRRALEKEKELTELKSRLVSMTSHEFRTPLTTIQANAELLSIKLNSTIGDQREKLEKHLGRITSEVSKLTRLMDDILLMGRFESGKITFQPEDLDLVNFIRDILQNKSNWNDSREVNLKVMGQIRPFSGDAALLTHVFTNLISNALKYSKDAVAPEMNLIFEDSGVRVVLKDYGIGIPDGERGKLFQTFYRASNASGIQGTGMGLVVVKQFVEIHGGTVSIESKENSGTTVTLHFPFQR